MKNIHLSIEGKDFLINHLDEIKKDKSKKRNLMCVEDCISIIFTKGQLYEIVYEDDKEIILKDEQNQCNTLSKKKQDEHYYGKWF
ncbi:hypothetical protein [Paenibacillus cremeus]|uniref:Uncharacterized protein n=1 Tax=Paenibacillus cremeus TaxID=2163881 RepID=A0A559KCQ8_9BACL|nr:hypothetical protein [Paenibacillus cremeus]TVY09915.1 hypothetical protein FPZ49_11125 [Paenibacillus cremeus]